MSQVHQVSNNYNSVPAQETHVDVLIIGAGPAGVMAANALNGAGVNVKIIDNKPTGITAGQADGLMPRTLEIMQSYGLAEIALKMGSHLARSTFYNPSSNGGIERTARSPAVCAPTARWGHYINLHQGSVEEIFLESMESKGLKVDRLTHPTSMKLSETADELADPDIYVARVALQRTGCDIDTSESVHAKYVLGADGAHSWVRKTLGIEMEGDSTASVWGVLDFVPDTDFPDFRALTYVHSHAGTLFIIPREGDMVRVYIQEANASHLIDPMTGRVNKNRTTPEKLLLHAQKILSPYWIDIRRGQDVHWWTVYSVGQRVAKAYSLHDRVFISGDACHTHSPKAGQGMNAAMADTHNLAWKLAYVLKGWAKTSLLKTYEAERRKFAQDLIAFDKHYSKLFSRKPWSAENPDGVTHEQFLDVYETSGGFTSGIGIRYEPSLIVNNAHQDLASNLIVGERVSPQVFVRAADSRPYEIQDLLPADTRFKVLVFGGDIALQRDRARMQAVADELAKEESFLTRYGRGQKGEWEVFDVLAFSSAKHDTVDYLDFPEFFRPHWSKVFLDDCDMHGRSGGGGYAKYGIDEHEGAIVVVRPDGYVGIVASLDGSGVQNVDAAYFGAFLM